MTSDDDTPLPPFDPRYAEATEFPVARPALALPVPLARPAASRTFPEIGMSRVAAGVDVLIITALVFFIQMFIVASGISDFLIERFPAIGIFWGNAVMGLAILAIIGVMLMLRRQGCSAIGLGRARPATVAIGVVIAVPASYVAVLIVVPIFLTLMGISFEELIAERSEFFDEIPELPAWGAAVFAMFVGLHEEVLFRGFVLGRLQSVLKSNIGAVIASSVIFGVMHGYQGMVGVIQTGTVGLVLAILTVRMRTLWPAVIAHGIFDTIGLVLIPLLRDEFGELLQELTTTSTSMPS